MPAGECGCIAQIAMPTGGQSTAVLRFESPRPRSKLHERDSTGFDVTSGAARTVLLRASRVVAEVQLIGELGRRQPYEVAIERGLHLPLRDACARRMPPRFSAVCSQITAREVQWLWEHRIPLGKLTLLAGLAGQGKSLFTVDLAARA